MKNVFINAAQFILLVTYLGYFNVCWSVAKDEKTKRVKILWWVFCIIITMIVITGDYFICLKIYGGH